MAQLLDDHHLVVLSDKPANRTRFAQEFHEYARSIPDTQAISIDGTRAATLDGFCAELTRHLPGQAAIATMPEVINVLRKWPGSPKRLYLIWRDADASLDSDVELFGRLVNAICSVAVEHEHLNPARLVLQRAMFIGNSKLGAYAEDMRGQFSRWLDEFDLHAENADDSPFWEAQSCVDRPSVLTYRIDA